RVHQNMNRGIRWLPLGVVFGAGFFLRLYSYHHTYVLNPDGILYIQQARALSYGLFDSITTCYSWFSPLPILIAVNYKIFGNWLIAAKIVSVIFGTATLFPLYLILRQFLDKHSALITLLVFAVNPLFVFLSADVLRDPVYWFLMTLGLCLFIRNNNRQGFSISMSLSCLFFILAVWTRIEAIIFVAVSPIFLLVTEHERKWSRFFSFMIPIVILFLAGLALLVLCRTNINEFIALERVFEMVTEIGDEYATMRCRISELIDHTPKEMSRFFLPEVRNLLWWLALGILLVEMTRTFFLPFFLVFIIGLAGAGKRIRQDVNLCYLTLMGIVAIILLYFQILHDWIMTKRFVALFFFPVFVFTGFGFKRIADIIMRRLPGREIGIYVAIGLLIFFVALPKNLKENREDKVVFQEIGRYITTREGNGHEILTAGSFKRIKLIHFFSNLNYKGAPCFSKSNRIGRHVPVNISFLRDNNFTYFVWDEENRSAAELEMFRKEYAQDLTEVGEWQDKKLGRLVVFRVEPPSVY
ncbi:MAG: glycosyltransferase family 39 protein, partial [Candidatus Omnitrophica bacterium]|nr:glycosyltransferase family 39 protein [Candidatus Omnitrophota bacterium]